MRTKSGVNQFWISIPLGILSVVAFLAATLSPGYSEANAAGKEGTAPDWSLKDLNGKEISFSQLKGKVVIVDFWATWCPPCRAEIPGFVELYKKYEKDGLVIVGMSLDEKGASVVKPFVKKQKMNYPVVLADDKIADAFGGVKSIPSTFIINRKGQIVQQHVGFADKKEFEKEIKALL